MIGRTVAHYEIVDKLGEGGMGVVYKAEDTRLKRTVALKFLPPHLLTSDVERQRFLNEARTAAGLSHTGICTVYEIDTAGEHTFIAMEYISGEDLAKKIASEPLEFNQAAGIALDLCNALAEAHQSNVIHRDIKPSNVMTSDRGRTVLLGFGLARLKTDPKIARTGTTVGTSAYMSPEQIRGEGVDHRSDIWSLGVVLYQMLTGQLPFKADHEAAVLYSIAHEDPEPISRVRPNVPARLCEIVEKALEKAPSDRYQNIDALQADLEVFLGRQEGRTVPASVELGVEEIRRRRLIRGGWVALFLTVVAAGVWLWPRGTTRVEGPASGGRVSTEGLSKGLSAPADPRATASSPVEARRASIAVLPLVNMSVEAGSEFFADGMTEEIIRQLARIKALKVISRTSAMQYKSTTKRLPQIASELGVANVLEGSVLRAGDRVRISVQLIDGASDGHLWTESYEGDLGDIVALQRNVARDVADEIEIELNPEEAARLATSTVVNKRAYDLYLQGRSYWSQRTPDGIRRAMGYYQEALAIDPGCALAYVGIAEAYAVAMSWAYMPTGEACAKARETAEKALSIDSDLAGAHAVLGLVAEVCDWEWQAAERHLMRAVELSPGDATAHQWYAQLLGATGRRSEAVAEARIASELDPLSAIVNGAAAVVLAGNGEFEAANALIEKARGFEPESPALAFYGSAVYHLMSEKEKSARALIRYLELAAEGDRDGEDVAALRDALDGGGIPVYNAVMLDILRRRDGEGQIVAACCIAIYFARMGEADSAMFWLERACERREGSLHAILAGGDSFDILRSDPRFHDLLNKMNLPVVE